MRRALFFGPTRPAILLAAVAALLIVSAPATAMAQTNAASSWLPWLGCWKLVNESGAEGIEPLDGERRVCLAEVDSGDGVELTTRVDDRVVLVQTMVTDGRDRAVQDGGCDGTERATWSADGNRLFVTASLACEGGHARRTSGVSMLTTGSRWTDIQVAEVAGQREIMVKIYRRDDSPRRGLEAGSRTNVALAGLTARQAAASPLDADDVVEALQRVDQAAVEAMLMESGTGFDMNADLLMYLADSEVPGSVIDLMVALSFPDYFMVNDDEADYDRNVPFRGGYVSRWGYPVWAYGYWSPAFSPFSYGYYYQPIRPINIGPGGGTFGGRVVNGRGYTRVQTRGNLPSGGLSRLFSRGNGRGSNGGSGGRSGGSVTPKGASSGSSSGSGSSAPRTAKPRGGGL